jgi:hypothetical protein
MSRASRSYRTENSSRTHWRQSADAPTHRATWRTGYLVPTYVKTSTTIPEHSIRLNKVSYIPNQQPWFNWMMKGLVQSSQFLNCLWKFFAAMWHRSLLPCSQTCMTGIHPESARDYCSLELKSMSCPTEGWGARGSVVGWGTMLQVGLWPWDQLSL